MANQREQRKAIILGAGPSGLVTAWKLLENGWDVTLLEKADRVGGMCRTWKWGEFLVDTGPHIYHTPDEQLAKFWEKEFGDLFIKGEFWCKNVKGEEFNEYWDYPLSWESIARFPKDLKKQVLDELNHCSLEKRARAKNFSEYMDGQIGPTLREMFFEQYPKKIWGISTTEMTPEWAPKRIEIRQKVTPFYYQQWNAVGKYGTGCIYERIKDKILALGGKILLNTSVTGFKTQQETITGILCNDSKEMIVQKKDVIVSSLPLTLTGRLLGQQSTLQFRGIRSVYLAYNRPEILPEGIHWLYYDSNKVFFNRVTESKKLTSHVAPKNKTFLTAEITFSRGDEIDQMDSESLIKAVAHQIQLVGLAKADEMIDGSDNKEHFVYPLQFAGYREELAKVRSAVAKYPQLYSIGTGGDFYYADSQILFHKAFDTVAMLCGKDSSYTQVIRQEPKVLLNATVSLNGRMVGDGNPAYIIAEIGLNHNGSLDLAKQMIDEAKKTGCDAVKIQTFEAKSRVSRKVKAVKYAETIIGLEETIYDMFDRLSMSYEVQKEIFNYARAQGMEIFSTPFDEKSVDFLESIGCGVYKIASMDLVNLPLIKYAARTGKPLIISCGMSTLGQVEEAVQVVAESGNANLMLLHCNSSYPAAPHEMNLNVMDTFKKAFRVPVGLSDHTFGLFVSHTALAIGANMIERHFTLDRTLEGPDHILSSEPEEMAELVKIAHEIPMVLGDGIKRIAPSEYASINVSRKSLYAACFIKQGQVITKGMLITKGPGGGLLPRYMDMVVGRTARVDIQEDYPVTWDVI